MMARFIRPSVPLHLNMARAWTRDKEQAASAEEQIPETPPNGVEIYTDDNPPQGPLYNYWCQRYSLFTRYDEGVWITQNGWFEVTPEKVARKIADHVLDSPVETILDAFCGIGGNSIQFALSTNCKRVIAVDQDQTAIDCARHNAKVYGVLDKIEFVVGDVFQLIDERDPRLMVDAVFMSPPWGGPSYRGLGVFDLNTLEPYSGYALSIPRIRRGCADGFEVQCAFGRAGTEGFAELCSLLTQNFRPQPDCEDGARSKGPGYPLLRATEEQGLDGICGVFIESISNYPTDLTGKGLVSIGFEETDTILGRQISRGTHIST